MPRFALATALSVLALALPASAAEPAACQLGRLAEWPVRLMGNLPVIEGSINGKSTGILLDTGAYASLITKPAAEKYDLWTRATAEVASGVGGESRVMRTSIRELRIREATVENMRVRVAGERAIPGVDFILGDDFHRKVDLEFDYASKMVRVYKPSPGCARSWLAYWDPAANQVPLDGDERIFFEMQVNGRAVRAMLDSGASSSVVSITLAKKLGVGPGTPGVFPSSCSAGIGSDIVQSWVAPFESLTIGGETIRDARLRVMDLSDAASSRGGGLDIIIGTDFLKAHRVYVARHQGKLYFTYGGGLVFPATPEFTCDARVAGKDMTMARAAYDQLLAQKPDDLQALLGRGAIRLAQDDAKGAIADLDRVLGLEPNNTIALATRAAAHVNLRQYALALVDLEAAISHGMRTPWVFSLRARAHAGAGDAVGALGDIDEVLKLDPRESWALRMRGIYSFYAGRFEAAEAAIAEHMAVSGTPYDPLWLSLARRRRGLDGNAVLDKWLASSKGSAWPVPVMQHLLGQLDFDALLAAAKDGDEAKQRGQLCEARFYAGAQRIADGKAAEARPLLERARDECPRNFIEFDGAGFELAALPTR